MTFNQNSPPPLEGAKPPLINLAINAITTLCLHENPSSLFKPPPGSPLSLRESGEGSGPSSYQNDAISLNPGLAPTAPLSCFSFIDCFLNLDPENPYFNFLREAAAVLSQPPPEGGSGAPRPQAENNALHKHHILPKYLFECPYFL